MGNCLSEEPHPIPQEVLATHDIKTAPQCGLCGRAADIPYKRLSIEKKEEWCAVFGEMRHRRCEVLRKLEEERLKKMRYPPRCPATAYALVPEPAPAVLPPNGVASSAGAALPPIPAVRALADAPAASGGGGGAAPAAGDGRPRQRTTPSRRTSFDHDALQADPDGEKGAAWRRQKELEVARAQEAEERRLAVTRDLEISAPVCAATPPNCGMGLCFSDPSGDFDAQLEAAVGSAQHAPHCALCKMTSPRPLRELTADQLDAWVVVAGQARHRRCEVKRRMEEARYQKERERYAKAKQLLAGDRRATCAVLLCSLLPLAECSSGLYRLPTALAGLYTAHQQQPDAVGPSTPPGGSCSSKSARDAAPAGTPDGAGGAGEGAAGAFVAAWRKEQEEEEEEQEGTGSAGDSLHGGYSLSGFSRQSSSAPSAIGTPACQVSPRPSPSSNPSSHGLPGSPGSSSHGGARPSLHRLTPIRNPALLEARSMRRARRSAFDRCALLADADGCSKRWRAQQTQEALARMAEARGGGR
eukprot:scaffold2.g7250.t1